MNYQQQEEFTDAVRFWLVGVTTEQFAQILDWARSVATTIFDHPLAEKMSEQSIKKLGCEFANAAVAALHAKE